MRVLIGITSSRGDLAAYAEALAVAAAGSGSVYRGVTPAPPEQRTAAAAPTDLVLAIAEADGARMPDVVQQWAHAYLVAHPDATLTFEREGRRADVRADDLDGARSAIARLAST
jgi:hypothetical protein